VKSHYEIHQTNGDQKVSCYNLESPVTTVLVSTDSPTSPVSTENPTTLPAANCPDIVSFDASSTTNSWKAENVADSGTNTFWMSGISTGNPEWVSFEYNQMTVLTSVEIQFVNGRQGSSPVFQGSNDASNWDDIIDVTGASQCPMVANNQRKCQFAIASTQAYKFYRYYSSAISSYVLLNHIVPTCVPNSNTLITRRLLGNIKQGSEQAKKMSSRKN